MMESRTSFVVGGVCCSTEEGVLRKYLDAVVGRDRYTFNQVTGELRVAPGVEPARAMQGIRDAGFTAREKRAAVPPAPFLERHRQVLVAAAASLLALAGMALQQTSLHSLVPRAVLLAAIITGGWPIARKGWKALRTRTLDMNVLMTAAVVGAAAIGKWDEAAAVIVLFSVALILESYSVARTRNAIRSLLALSPEKANVVREGKEERVAADAVVPGDRVVIRPGERIPVDGIVVEGASAVTQAAITGESMPVAKAPGDSIFAGSINERGSLTIAVTHRFEDTMLARIVSLVEEAQQERAPVQHFVDRFAAIYTPAVFLFAVLLALLPPVFLHEPFVDWLYRALVVLVIACPCALVISTPVTIVSALTNAARHGILVKGGKYLETVAEVRAIAFDKTGTLTEGKPRVTDVVAFDSMPRDEVLRLVAAIEVRSEHPFASAVLAEAARRGIVTDTVRIERFEALPGRGVRAMIDGRTYTLGNRALCEEQGYSTPGVQDMLSRLSRDGASVIVLGRDGAALGAAAFRDTARQNSASVVKELEALGIRRLVMLSGDSESTAMHVASQVGLGHTAGGLLPDQKVAAVRKLMREHGTVAMVGDGINDAPALATASVGIAMGVTGTDAALENASIILMTDNLSHLPHLFSLSRKTMAIVRQNIIFALTVKLVFLLLSVSGAATLWMALLADDGAALAVIVNGLRMLSYRNEP
jgi:Cd2+/Zn2+-exporting ATPase